MKRLLAIATFMVVVTLSFEVSKAQSVNVRIDPLTMLLGILNAEVDIKASSAWTAGPTVSSFNYDVGDSSISGGALGARANYFFNGSVFTDSWYFGPFIKFASVEAENKITNSSAKVTGTGVGAIMGYHWSWNTFNIQLGGGLVNYTIPAGEVTDAGDRVEYEGISGTIFAGEFSIGWKF